MRAKTNRGITFFAKRTHPGSWCPSCLCGSTPKITKRSHCSARREGKGEGGMGRKRDGQLEITKRTHLVRNRRFQISDCSEGSSGLCPQRFYQTNPFPDSCPWCAFVVQPPDLPNEATSLDRRFQDLRSQIVPEGWVSKFICGI